MSYKLQCLRTARLAARHPNFRPCNRSFASTASNRSSTAGGASDFVRIVEVGPRDGLQNEKNSIPLETKIELIERLARTGLSTIEAGSFVSPKWTPQMANSSEILEHILRAPPQSPQPVTYQWLLPNVKGMENFLKVWEEQGNGTNGQDAYPTHPPSPGAEEHSTLNTSSQDPNAMSSTTPPSPSPSLPLTEISLFTAATESFTRKNTNCTIAESLSRFPPILSAAKRLSLPVRAYISVALGCPFEGAVDPHKVAELAVSLLEMGVDSISIADTTGMGTAISTATLLKTLSSAGVERSDIALHFHDTYGQALVNAVVALEYGIRTFDASVGGLGGCPYSPGATGNVATEDLVYCFESLGARMGVDLGGLAEVGEWVSGVVGRGNESRVGKAVLARRRREGREGR